MSTFHPGDLAYRPVDVVDVRGDRAQITCGSGLEWVDLDTLRPAPWPEQEEEKEDGMSCRINEDDRCQHGVPVESPDMHDCPHDGFRCSPCGHPACHTVTAKVVRVPHLGTRWRGVCVLCKLAGPLTDDKSEASEWETTHHARVMGR